MISRPSLLSSCMIASSLLLLVRKSEGFSRITSHESSSRAQPQLFDDSSPSLQPYFSSLPSALSATYMPVDTAGPVNEFDLATKELASFSKKGKKKATSTKMKSGIESEFPKRKIKASVRETGTDSMKYYIKSMCNHELLNKNEEIILAREIQILIKWEKERETLEEQLLRPPTYAEWASSIQFNMTVPDLKKTNSSVS